MASVPPPDPDPRTAPDDDDAYDRDATFGEGESASDPAEGVDDEAGRQGGSPAG